MKILALDIETYPGKAWEWSPFDTNPVPLERWIEPSGLLCFGAQWVGEKPTHFLSLWDDGEVGMANAAQALLDEADAVLHFNGKRFDIPRLNGAIILHAEDRRPPLPFKQIDLYPVVRRQFGFDYGKLAFIAPLLGLGVKAQTGGFSTWPACLAGDEKAQRKMKRYCLQDVRLLTPAYQLLLPWIPGHPNQNLYNEVEGCPQCGAPRSSLQRMGFQYTNVSTFQRWLCTQCRKTCRSTKRTDHTTLQGVAAS